MKCSSGLANPAEKKAILFALLSSLVFIGFLAVVNQLVPHRKGRPVVGVGVPSAPKPVKPVTAPAPLVEHPPDKLSRFRVVPSNFKSINFGTRNYGNYRMSDGTNRDLVLIDGQFRDFGSSEHRFDLYDVLYTDLTGDKIPEAIVMMTHIECDRKCDGGKNLVYVYSQNYPIQEILKYESGSGMNGCSLKALTVKNRRLTLDLFGKCPQPAGTSEEFVVRETYDVTRLEFFFNGKQLVPKPATYLTLTNRYEVNYGVNISISDDRTPLPKYPI